MKLMKFATAVTACVCFLAGFSAPAQASTITFDINGMLGPLIAGSDPLNLSGQAFTVTGSFDSSLIPASTTSDSATYNLPVNLIIMVGTAELTGYNSSLTLTVPPSGADMLSLDFSVIEYSLTPEAGAVLTLPEGTLSGTTIQPFTASADPTGSFLLYTVFGNSAEVYGMLGITGTAAVSAATGVPEPGTLGLMCAGLALAAAKVCGLRRRRRLRHSA